VLRPHPTGGVRTCYLSIVWPLLPCSCRLQRVYRFYADFRPPVLLLTVEQVERKELQIGGNLVTKWRAFPLVTSHNRVCGGCLGSKRLHNPPLHHAPHTVMELCNIVSTEIWQGCYEYACSCEDSEPRGSRCVCRFGALWLPPLVWQCQWLLLHRRPPPMTADRSEWRCPVFLRETSERGTIASVQVLEKSPTQPLWSTERSLKRGRTSCRGVALFHTNLSRPRLVCRRTAKQLGTRVTRR
jgi:hypothetical protein